MKEYQGFKDLTILVLDVFIGEKFSMGYGQMAAWKPEEEVLIVWLVSKSTFDNHLLLHFSSCFVSYVLFKFFVGITNIVETSA